MAKARTPMMCVKPYVGSTGPAFGCGQCMPCRFNKRRIWMHRIMLEAAQYKDNAFLTLTYDDEHLPENGSLVPRDYQLFLKSLRKAFEPFRFRYFFVGEYGDESQRPHYHAALFGFPTCRSGDTRTFCKRDDKACDWCRMVRKAWGKGNIMLGRLEDDSAGYMAGYVTKKMTAKDDTRLNGRYPEFGRMSLRPGLGYQALWDISDAILRYELDKLEGDVPASLRHGNKELPLGRYLRMRLRQMVGGDGKATQETMDKIAAELLPLRLAARADKENPSLSSKIVEANAGKLASMEARQRIYRKGKVL